MTRAISGPNVRIPRIFLETDDKNCVKQNPSFTVGSLVAFMGFHNKSPEITIIGIIYMFEAFLTLDYGHFSMANLSPLFGLMPMLLRTFAFPGMRPNPMESERIIVEKVEK